MHDPYPLKLCR